MLFVYPEFGTILFSPNVLNTFIKYQQKQIVDPEAGGYLFGRQFNDQVVIEIATEPDRTDLRDRFFILRNKVKANKIFSRFCKITNGELFLAGEWHTHPEKYPKPSQYDKIEILKSFKGNHYPLKFMSVVIIGNGAISESWIGVQNAKQLLQLTREGELIWKR